MGQSCVVVDGHAVCRHGMWGDFYEGKMSNAMNMFGVVVCCRSWAKIEYDCGWIQLLLAHGMLGRYVSEEKNKNGILIRFCPLSVPVKFILCC